jgi:tetratricopeptide (TPR) repeat protein
MENGQIICPRRRGVPNGLKEFAAKGCYSVIFIVLALILVRPLMVSQMISRADAYSAFGMYQDCKRECNKALLIDSDNSKAWCRLARIYRTEGDRDMAYAAYLNATQADATNKPAHFELGIMYTHDKLYREAIPYFDQVRKLGQDKPEYLRKGGFHYHRAALDMLAMCYEKAGDIAKAEFTLEEIRVFYPNYAKVDPRLAELKERQKK